MRFRLLGSIEVGRDDDVVAIGGPQQRRLLAVLLSERDRGVSRPATTDVTASRHDAQPASQWLDLARREALR